MSANQLRLALLAPLMARLSFSFFSRNWAHQSAMDFGKIALGLCTGCGDSALGLAVSAGVPRVAVRLIGAGSGYDPLRRPKQLARRG